MREILITGTVEHQFPTDADYPKGIVQAFQVNERVWTKQDGEHFVPHIVYVNEYNAVKLRRVLKTNVRLFFRARRFEVNQQYLRDTGTIVFEMYYCDVLDT